MEPVPQSAVQQQGRQQPLYDIRGGGHYGNFLNEEMLLLEVKSLT